MALRRPVRRGKRPRPARRSAAVHGFHHAAAVTGTATTTAVVQSQQHAAARCVLIFLYINKSPPTGRTVQLRSTTYRRKCAVVRVGPCFSRVPIRLLNRPPTNTPCACSKSRFHTRGETRPSVLLPPRHYRYAPESQQRPDTEETFRRAI